MIRVLSDFSCFALLFYFLGVTLVAYLGLFAFKMNKKKEFEKQIRVFSLLVHLINVILASYFLLLAMQDWSGLPIADSFLLHWDYKVKFSLGFGVSRQFAYVYAIISYIILWCVYRLRYNIKNYTKYTFWLLLVNIITLLYTSFFAFREFIN